MASVGSAVSHRGTVELGSGGAVGAADTQFIGSGSLAHDLTQQTQTTNNDKPTEAPNDATNQQPIDTAASSVASGLPDPIGTPIPLSPIDSASPGRHGSAERASSKRRSRAATQSPQRLSGPRRDSSAGLTTTDESQVPRRLITLESPKAERIRELEAELSDVKTKMADLEHFIYDRQTRVVIDEAQSEVKRVVDLKCEDLETRFGQLMNVITDRFTNLEDKVHHFTEVSTDMGVEIKRMAEYLRLQQPIANTVHHNISTPLRDDPPGLNLTTQPTMPQAFPGVGPPTETISSMQSGQAVIGSSSQAFKDLQARHDARTSQPQRPTTVTFSEPGNNTQAYGGVQQTPSPQSPTQDASVGAQAPNIRDGIPVSTTGLFAPLHANMPHVTHMPTHQQAQGQPVIMQQTSQVPFLNTGN